MQIDMPGDPRATASMVPGRRPRYLQIAWVLLLLYGLFPIVAALLDLIADRRSGLPSDHTGAFLRIVGLSWAAARTTAHGSAAYITLLERAYAVHELVFGILFLAIVAIPFRRGERWAWWAAWVPMLATITYSLTFGRHDPASLRRGLYADVALPLLLLVQLPAFYGRWRWREVPRLAS